jgi:hypothetical protein
MASDAYATASQEIAAEQRKVRAEFVFMMGGELADAPDLSTNMTDLNEQAEAEGESDLAAGRMANQGRIALLSAIRSMSRAAAALTTADLPVALTHERAALTQLERAFSRSRILLRALTENERLDLSRRLTGNLVDLARDVRPSAAPVASARVVALRRALADLAAVAGSGRLPADAAVRVSTLAASVLQVDPSDKSLQDVSARLTAAATDLERGGASNARRELDQSATALAAALRGELLAAPMPAAAVDVSRLRGALGDALQRRPGEPH